jgi:hypothetical protein
MVKYTWGGDLRTIGRGSGTRSRGEQSHEDKIRLESSKSGPGNPICTRRTGLGGRDDAPKRGSKKIGSRIVGRPFALVRGCPRLEPDEKGRKPATAFVQVEETYTTLGM